MIRPLLRSCVPVLALVPSARAGVLHLETGATYGELQEAVAAAADGDHLLVATGTYAPVVVDGKGLWILEAPGSAARIAGTLEVRNLSVEQVVVIDGLHVEGAIREIRSDPGLRCLDNACQVRVHGCTLAGGVGFEPEDDGYAVYGDGGNGVELLHSLAVVIVSSTIEGGVGGTSPALEGDGCFGGAGGLPRRGWEPRRYLSVIDSSIQL